MLEVKNVDSGYGKVQILNGLSMTTKKEKITTLLGGNGTGKSTLLKVISGLLPVWKGQVLFDGEDITKKSPHTRVNLGLVQITQGKEAFPAMTIEENLLLGAYSIKSRKQRKENLEKIYQHFPILKEKRKLSSGLLSGGQLQMLCVGRGLMSNPKMLMLDEPSAALAPQIVLEIFRSLYKISQTGTTILLIEQNVRMALLLAEYGYVIKDGKINLQGPSDDLINNDSLRQAYLGGTVADKKK
jgi:branched-chain amino acid transport system ATP-binding protein